MITTPRPAAATIAALQSASIRNTFSCFVYGTLMSEQVLEILIGRVPTMIRPAFLPNHVRHPVQNFAFPGVIPLDPNRSLLPTTSSQMIKPFPWMTSSNDNRNSHTGFVQGILLTELTEQEMQIFDWFEDTDYLRSIVSVWIPGVEQDISQTITSSSTSSSTWVPYDTNIYLWARETDQLELDKEWDYNAFVQDKLEWYLENTVRPCRKALDELDIGKIRLSSE